MAQLALAQRRLGHEVEVAVDSLRSRATSEELALPRFRDLGFRQPDGLELSVKSSPAGIFRDMRILRRLEMDLVHSHFSHDHLIASLALKRQTRLIRSIHAPRSLRRLMPRAQGWTFPFEGLPFSGRFQPGWTLPALVDSSFQPPADRNRLREELRISGSPVLGMVSTFQASRRHELALQAFSELLNDLPQAVLVLVGDGERQEAIRAQAKALGIDEKVIFAGYQSGSAFIPWLQSLDLVWILGLGNDWSARAAAQARACGVKVVGVRQGALPQHSQRLVSPSPSEIAAASVAVLREENGPSLELAELRSPDDIAAELMDRLYHQS